MIERQAWRRKRSSGLGFTSGKPADDKTKDKVRQLLETVVIWSEKVRTNA